MAKKTYSDKLKDPRWQKVRLKVLERDEFMCQYCHNTEETLHVHHKSYIYGNDIWNYPESNFITFCETCHNDVTQLKKDVKAVIDSGFITPDVLGELHALLIDLSNQNPDKILGAWKWLNSN